MAEQSFIIIIPYDSNKVAQEAKFIGPMKMQFDPEKMAQEILFQYGRNVHWHIEADVEWTNIVHHIKQTLDQVIKGRPLNDGVIAGIEAAIKIILTTESKQKVVDPSTMTPKERQMYELEVQAQKKAQQMLEAKYK